MKLPHVEVSDHAVLRYLERVTGMVAEIAAVRARIAAETFAAVAMGATQISRNGIIYVIKDGTVVTIGTGESPAAFTINGFRSKGDNSHQRKSPATRADAHQIIRRLKHRVQRPEGRR